MGAMKMNVQINGREQQVHAGLVSVATLYEIAACGENRVFLNREDGIDIPLLPEENLLIHGGEKFVTGENSIENNPRLRNGVQPEFNGSHELELPTAKISGKALKERDDKFPDGRLFADIKDGVDVEIPDDMIIVVQDKDSYFVIPPADEDDDDSIDIEKCGKHKRRPPKGKKYGKHGLLIREFSILAGYTIAQTTLMILIPSGYPASALDMFYFDPPLNKSDGSPINALASEDHFGQTWQRWSRHYEWKAGEV